MLAWITTNGQLTIKPETETQAYALTAWLKNRTELVQAFSNQKEEVVPVCAIVIEPFKSLTGDESETI